MKTRRIVCIANLLLMTGIGRTQTSPYQGVAARLPGPIAVENFDEGGPDVAPVAFPFHFNDMGWSSNLAGETALVATGIRLDGGNRSLQVPKGSRSAGGPIVLLETWKHGTMQSVDAMGRLHAIPKTGM